MMVPASRRIVKVYAKGLKVPLGANVMISYPRGRYLTPSPSLTTRQSYDRLQVKTFSVSTVNSPRLCPPDSFSP